MRLAVLVPTSYLSTRGPETRHPSSSFRGAEAVTLSLTRVPQARWSRPGSSRDLGRDVHCLYSVALTQQTPLTRLEIRLQVHVQYPSAEVLY